MFKIFTLAIVAITATAQIIPSLLEDSKNYTVLMQKAGLFKTSFAASNSQADLVASLRDTAASLMTPLPGDFGQLCSNVRPTARSEFERTNSTQLANILAKWALPKAVTDFMLNIKYAESLGYQTFNFVIKKGETSIDEYIAAGRNYQGQIFIAFIGLTVQGTPITQYTQWQACKRNWYGKKKCWTESAPRGFYTNELLSIQNGLLHHGYKALIGQIDTLSKNNQYVEAVKDFQSTATEQKIDLQFQSQSQSYFSELQQWFQGLFKKRQQDQPEVVQKINKLNFQSLSQSGIITYIKGINATRFIQYAQAFLDSLDVDKDIKQGVKDFIDTVPLSEMNIWTSHKVFYSANNSSYGNYLVFMTYKSDDGLMRVYTARIRTDFVLGPDIYILSSSKSSFLGLKTKSQYLYTTPHKMTEEDAKIILNYFDMVVMDRFRITFEKRSFASAPELKQYTLGEVDFIGGRNLQGNTTDKKPLPSVTPADKFLDIVSKAYDVVKKIFSKSTTTKIIERITNLSFNSFSSKAQIQMYKGVPFHLVPTLKQAILKIVGGSSSKWGEQIKASLNFEEDIGAGVTQLLDHTFKDSNGKVNAFSLIWTRDDLTGKYSVLVSYIKSSFTIAGDIYIWQTQKSRFGGLITSDKQSLEIRPHNVTPDEAKLLLNFFEMTAMEKFNYFIKTFGPLINF